jgi:probable HAF family extracellular repeat protein
MKKQLSVSIAAFALAVLASSAQRSLSLEARAPLEQGVRYKLIDLGSLGGPNSYLPYYYVDDASTPQAIAADGAFVGWADTAVPDPYAATNTCFFDCWVNRAFRWKDGVRTPLPALPGPPGLSAASTWMSRNGLMVGFSENGIIDPNIAAPAFHAVLWRNDQIVDLEALPGGYESEALAVNSRGEVVGFSSNAMPDGNSLQSVATQTRAFIWHDGVMQDLGTLGGTDAQASYINDRGQVIGESYTADSGPKPAVGCIVGAPLTTHAFFWEKDRMTDLLTLGGSCTQAYGINNRGQVIGQSSLPGDTESHPFVWEHGTMTDLHTLGGSYGFAAWLSDAGDVVGSSSTQGTQDLVAFYWKSGPIENLGTLIGNVCSVADAVNSQGLVVGGSGLSAAAFFPACTDAVEHAVLWQNGRILDLNAFVPPDSDLTLNEAVFINDSGEISGFGTLPNGDTHDFLLVPCREGEEGCELASTGLDLKSGQSNPAAMPRVPSFTMRFAPQRLKAAHVRTVAGG